MTIAEQYTSETLKRKLLSVVTFITALSLLTLSLAELALQYLNVVAASLVAIVALLMLTLSILRFFTLREWVLLLFCLVLSVGIWRRDANAENILLALDRAAFFAAFIYLVTLLKEAALRSGSVALLGAYLTQQPPQRRFFSLAVGGHFLGVLLNFGAISLLTPLIQKGCKQASLNETNSQLANQSSSRDLEQQQISALLRGFSWMIMWSPTALTQAILYTSIPSASPAVVIPMGIAASVVMIMLGRWEDWFRWRTSRVLMIEEVPDFPKQAAKRFLIVCGSMIALTILTMLTADVSAAHALMLVAPFIMVIWTIAQSRTRSSNVDNAGTTIQTLASIVVGSSRVLGMSSFTLAAAGFIGVAAASLAPVEALALQIEALSIPDWLFLMCLPLLIIAGGQIALSPILVVVFLSSILNQFPVLPADPNLIVFALGAGWALSMTAAPNASATLLISGVTGIAPTTLTWRWNGRYALLCLLTFFLSFYILASSFQLT